MFCFLFCAGSWPAFTRISCVNQSAFVTPPQLRTCTDPPTTRRSKTTRYGAIPPRSCAIHLAAPCHFSPPASSHTTNKQPLVFALALCFFFLLFFFVPAFLFFSSVPFPFLLRVMQFEQLANMSISSGEADVQAPVFSLDRWSCEDLTSWLQQVRGGSALLGVCVVFCVVLCFALRCGVLCCVLEQLITCVLFGLCSHAEWLC